MGKPLKTKTRVNERTESGRREPPAQQPPWLLNIAHFCYDGKSPTNSDNEIKNNISYIIKKNIKRNLHRQVKEHGKYSRLYSGIHRYY